ncbi:MAG: CRISPR-associated protein Csx6 family [Myxococcaceae bacterium]|nr:CRISPR-associated protein Csx6 family [Myxococcaceae bacterium]
MIPCVLVGDLGPNPAPLAEALWALARQHRLRVRAAFLLTYARGAHYLDREFLAADGALDQMHAVLGRDVLPRDALFLRRVHADGAAIDDDWEPAHTLAWNEARWATALAALEAAGDDPVVFTLLGGRRRSMSALDAVAFQLLARPQDRLLDVRVSDTRVEGGSGFFFPEQRVPLVRSRGGDLIDARTVAVRLIDLPVPKLRRLLGERVPATYAEALARTDAAVERTPPMLTIDLAARSVRVGDHPVALPARQFAWYATLASNRCTSADDGTISADDFEAHLHRTLHRMKRLDPTWAASSGPVAKLLAVPAAASASPWAAIAPNEEWSSLRSTTRKLVRDAVDKLGLAESVASLFVPAHAITHVDKVKLSLSRLPLDPSRIEVLPAP